MALSLTHWSFQDNDALWLFLLPLRSHRPQTKSRNILCLGLKKIQMKLNHLITSDVQVTDTFITIKVNQKNEKQLNVNQIWGSSVTETRTDVCCLFNLRLSSPSLKLNRICSVNKTEVTKTNLTLMYHMPTWIQMFVICILFYFCFWSGWVSLWLVMSTFHWWLSPETSLTNKFTHKLHGHLTTKW